MTTPIEERLIALVRQNPALYEKSKRVTPYESSKERTEIWKSIASSLGLTSNECILNWKQLRQRYQEELRQQKETQLNTNTSISINKILNNSTTHTPLLEKMSFLNSYKTHRGPIDIDVKQKPNTVSVSTITEQHYLGINYDEPLQEAMDDQPFLSNEPTRKALTATTTTATTLGSNPTTYDNKSVPGSTVFTRIETLLGGLDTYNRNVAEKRILSYLCKCQLKTLEGENVNDVQI